jgi:uncharacterized lipoprotein
MRRDGIRAALRTSLIVALAAVAGCSWFHRGGTKCREPVLPTTLVNGADLKLPPGMDAPDTREEVRIPNLNEPEQARSRRDPCLSMPPSYKTTGQP